MQPVTPSSTDVDVTFRVLDSTTFLPYESLSSATPGLALWYQKGAAGSVTAITEGDHTNLTDAHSDGKLKHIDDGWYRLSLPDAAVPTAEHEVTTFGGTATGYVILGGAIVGKPIEVVSGSLVAASVTGAVGSVAAGGITAASIATGAVDAAALAADAVAEIQTGLALASDLATLATYVDTEVAAIKAKTDNLPTDPADQSLVEAAIAAGDDATLVAIAALNNLSSAQAQAAALAALTAYPVPLIADIEAAIAAGAGATPATFWNYTGPGGRTLTQSMIAILSSMIAGNTITITRGDTISFPITGLGDLSGRTGLWFTVKMHPSHETDAQAKVQITEDDGLIRLNGAEADVPGDGWFDIDDEVNGDITINLAADACAALIMSGTFPSRTTVKTWSWRWDVQIRQPGPGVWTPRSGAFVVEEDVTWAT
jgi:hypothetical protein